MGWGNKGRKLDVLKPGNAEEGRSSPEPQALAGAGVSEEGQGSWLCRCWKDCKLGLVAAAEKNCRSLGGVMLRGAGGRREEQALPPSQPVGQAERWSAESQPPQPKAECGMVVGGTRKRAKYLEQSPIFTREEADTKISKVVGTLPQITQISRYKGKIGI